MALGRIRHKALKRWYDKGDESKLPADLAPKIKRILSLLDVATAPEDMDLPGFALHKLTGDRAGQHAVSVNGNWRIVFRFEGDTPEDVDLVDYH